jgi:hypothetical protein
MTSRKTDDPIAFSAATSISISTFINGGVTIFLAGRMSDLEGFH